MQRDIITFELATHYLPKIALRLESLHQTAREACEETHPIIHHYALNNLIEIMKLVGKPELKSRFLKEFMRIEHLVHKHETKNSARLYAELQQTLVYLTQVTGQFGEGIHQDAFLNSIRYCQPNMPNENELFSPQLLVWLEANPALRQQHLVAWLRQLRTLQNTVGIYLHLLRDTAQFHPIELHNGFYQSPLPPKTNCHLIILRMAKQQNLFPRMQLGHHGLSIRLFEAQSLREIKESHAQLELGICQL